MERRDFLKLIAATAATSFLSGCIGKKFPTAPLLPEEGDGDEGFRVSSGGPFDYNPDNSICAPHHNTVTLPHQNALPAAINPPKHKRRARRRTARPAEQHQNLTAISRNRWHARKCKTNKVCLMNGVERVTVHHEGNPKPNYDSNSSQVARSLRQIQRAHFKMMGAADIAYHFIIDRQGMIWQGREMKYQGAHTKGNNAHNIGIMCLGNFNLQRPSMAQLNSLEQLCATVLAGYGIPPSKLYGHRELRSTACPGKHLFPFVKSMRYKFSCA